MLLDHNIFFLLLAIFNHRCGVGLFNCSQTQCISTNKLCDGVRDCKSNVETDEDPSICCELSSSSYFNSFCSCIALLDYCFFCLFYLHFLVVLDCGHDNFACPEKCLPKNSVCDGIYDCMDGSDEIGCSKLTKLLKKSPSFIICFLFGIDISVKLYIH